MRCRGGGVGHKATREWDDFLRSGSYEKVSCDIVHEKSISVVYYDPNHVAD
jgi:hypothetical protein